MGLVPVGRPACNFTVDRCIYENYMPGVCDLIKTNPCCNKKDK